MMNPQLCKELWNISGHINRKDKKMSGIAQFTRSTLDIIGTLLARPRAAKRDCSAGRSLRGVLCLGGVAAMTMLSTPANANINHQMNLKLYAHNQIDDWNEFVCFVDLIQRESSWRYWVSNGSHHGLGQMRSKWYKDLTPREQIKATLKYIDHRYGGKICDGALASSLKRGWY